MLQVAKQRFKPLHRELVRTLMYLPDPYYLPWRIWGSRRLMPFKNKHSGASCFIIGNGPSLNRMDLSLLQDCQTFGLNKIYLLFDRVDLNLSYHVAVNSLVVGQSIEQFQQLNCPSFLSHRACRGLLKGDHPHIYRLYTADGPFTFEPDITRPLQEGYTVTYVAMQIAFFMGFQRVYLIGVDHNFVAQGAPNQEQLLRGRDLNHFDPNYFRNQAWHLPDLAASEVAYRLAQYYFRQDGREILDATVDGKLNVFPKVPYEEALRDCRKNS